MRLVVGSALLLIAYDAYKINATSDGIKLQWYNKWYFYIGIAICFYIIETGSLLAWGYQHFRIVNDSNIPTLQQGDIVMAKMAYGFVKSYPVGSIVLYKTLNYFEGKRILIRRIVAISGDTFAIKNGKSFLNDNLISEPYVLASNKLSSCAQNYEPIKVPKDSILVLSDNRDKCKSDEQDHGLVPVKYIQGKALYILFSTTFSRIGLRVD